MSLKTSLVLALLCGVVMAAVADPYYYYYYYYGIALYAPGATFVASGTIPCNCFYVSGRNLLYGLPIRLRMR